MEAVKCGSLSKEEQKKSLSSQKKNKKVVKLILDTPLQQINHVIPRIESNHPFVEFVKNHLLLANLTENASAKSYRDKLAIGVNQVSKNIRGGKAVCVVLASDVKPPTLTSHIIETCAKQKIPVVNLAEMRRITLNNLGFECISFGFLDPELREPLFALLPECANQRQGQDNIEQTLPTVVKLVDMIPSNSQLLDSDASSGTKKRKLNFGEKAENLIPLDNELEKMKSITPQSSLPQYNDSKLGDSIPSGSKLVNKSAKTETPMKTTKVASANFVSLGSKRVGQGMSTGSAEWKEKQIKPEPEVEVIEVQSSCGVESKLNEISAALKKTKKLNQKISRRVVALDISSEEDKGTRKEPLDMLDFIPLNSVTTKKATEPVASVKKRKREEKSAAYTDDGVVPVTKFQREWVLDNAPTYHRPKAVPAYKKVRPDGRPTLSAHPAKFSPEDKYSAERIRIKRRFGLLPTQQPPQPY